MDKSLLQYAYFQYAGDVPHDNIIQALINKGVNPTDAQRILDIAIITYCTQSGQTSSSTQSSSDNDDDNEIGVMGVIKLIFGLLGLIASVVKCMN
jgi:hypothetical protein